MNTPASHLPDIDVKICMLQLYMKKCECCLAFHPCFVFLYCIIQDHRGCEGVHA